jgi:glyoxylase-like metal-dependent hydrolase (beta-lactamase superfamily II)
MIRPFSNNLAWNSLTAGGSHHPPVACHADLRPGRGASARSSPTEPYGAFARSRRLTARGDVLTVPTPGHTPDHLSIIVEDGDAAIFLAGDASYSEQTMLEGRIDGVSVDEAVAATRLDTIRRFAAAQPTIYLPTHDPAAAQRLTRRETVAGLRDTIPPERAGLATLPAQAGGDVNCGRLSSATP